MGWRTYEAADKCAVDALHIEMQARLGQTFELPDLSKRPILVSLVYEKDGVITHAAALEAEAELMVLAFAWCGPSCRTRRSSQNDKTSSLPWRAF